MEVNGWVVDLKTECGEAHGGHEQWRFYWKGEASQHEVT